MNSVLRYWRIPRPRLPVTTCRTLWYAGADIDATNDGAWFDVRSNRPRTKVNSASCWRSCSAICAACSTPTRATPPLRSTASAIWAEEGAFADIRVVPSISPAYVVEVKFGYSTEVLLRHLKRKYSQSSPALASVAKLILLIDSERIANWPQIEAEISGFLLPGLQLEVWNEGRVIQHLRDRLHIEISSITPTNLVEVRQIIDRAQGYYAFGGDSPQSYHHEPLNAELLWHLGFSKIRQLREAKTLRPREILPPGLYRGVVVLLADLCSFSSYVRDTPDSSIVRESLTSFYSKSRYQIINGGGMLYQFVGDEVIGLFGVPERTSGYAQLAFETARSLVSIGKSVSHYWQRQIDRQQVPAECTWAWRWATCKSSSCAHSDRTHVGAVGDCINVAARLMSAAGSGEVTVSNSLHQLLNDATQARFQEVEPVEARNVGRIKACGDGRRLSPHFSPRRAGSLFRDSWLVWSRDSGGRGRGDRGPDFAVRAAEVDLALGGSSPQSCVGNASAPGREVRQAGAGRNQRRRLAKTCWKSC